MISGFMCSCHGFIQNESHSSYKVIKPGANYDGYWTNKDLVDQLREVIPLFSSMHEGCQLIFAFDNSQNHHAKAPDALNVNMLVLKDKGKNVPQMRSSLIHGQKFDFQYPNGDKKRNKNNIKRARAMGRSILVGLSTLQRKKTSN